MQKLKLYIKKLKINFEVEDFQASILPVLVLSFASGLAPYKVDADQV